MNFDYHMHTTCSDGKSTHEEMVLSAIRKGFTEIGFSDHFCIKQPCSWAVGQEGLNRFAEEVDRVRQHFSDRITIRLGIETDYFSDREEEISTALNQHPFDYVIGSIHFLDDWNYDTDQSRYPDYSNDYLYQWYFQELGKAAQSGLFDVMGHADLIKKFKIWPESNQKELYAQTASVFASSDVVFELNTSGKDRPCGEFFPGMDLLKEFHSANVSVTLGSDSHHSDQIGRHFDEAKTILSAVGYTKVVRFSNRERLETDIRKSGMD